MKISNDKFYKIRHTPTGLYKAKGFNGKFTKHGCIWEGKNVKLFLRQFQLYKVELIESIQKEWSTFSINDCEIIEYNMIETQKQKLIYFINKELK